MLPVSAFGYPSITTASIRRSRYTTWPGTLSGGERGTRRRDEGAQGRSKETDVAAVTVDESPGTAQQLADDIFDYCGFGYGASKDGVLLLIDMDNREVAITTTGEAQYSDTAEPDGRDSRRNCAKSSRRAIMPERGGIY